MTRWLTVMAFALVLPAAAAAQTGTTFDYTGHSGVVSGNVYVGPYTGTLGGVAYDIYCVDGMTTVNTAPYQAWVTSLTLTDVIGSGSYTKQTSVDTYMQAAWLAMQFDKSSTDDWGGIHQAIWDLTGGVAYSTGADGSWWSSQAQLVENYGTVNLSEWSVVSAQSIDSQEFLVRTNVVPEPGTWAMLLLGLFGVGGVALRRRSGTV